MASAPFAGKIAVIFGTRPEAIKLAPLILALRADKRFQCHVCVTGQHRQMLDQVMEVFAIKPDADLNLMTANQTLATLTSRLIHSLDQYLTQEKPNLVVVQGDTTTVLCATLAAFYHHIPVAHVEAGLRTGDLQAPWPEEANRILTSRLAALHFAPTDGSKQNLLREGVPSSQVTVTGNTVIDALFLALDKIKTKPPEIHGLTDTQFASWKDSPVVLITGHRRENFGGGFENICRAIARLADRFPQTQFVYPVHLNPNVRTPVEAILRRSAAKNIHLIEPLSYLPFVALLSRATVVLTDSGGIQEEAPSLGKPVLVMREVTERPEAVQAGTVKLVGTCQDKIMAEVSTLLTNPAAYQAMSRAHNPYGDGKATERIIKVCYEYLRIRAQAGQRQAA